MLGLWSSQIPYPRCDTFDQPHTQERLGCYIEAVGWPKVKVLDAPFFLSINRAHRKGGFIMPTLDSFASVGFSKLIPGTAGREQVRELVQQILKDETFVTTYINDNTPDRQVIYEDPELGFCICAHLNRGAKEANPHDHGSSWAIYGQAFGETEMSDWEIVEAAS
jgi:hypothetical protein